MREGIRPPAFADKFALIDFEAPLMPVISLYPAPATLATQDLRIEVCGLEQPLRSITAAMLEALPRVDVAAPLICQIFNWYEPVEWTGVRLADFLDAFQVATPAEGYYAVYSRDGVYFESLSADEARDPRVLLATHLNGAPLAAAHGGPVRLVAPFLQGYKSVKWVASVRAFRHDPVGIKRLLGQSPTGRLNAEWVSKLNIELPAGRAGDPAPVPAVASGSQETRGQQALQTSSTQRPGAGPGAGDEVIHASAATPLPPATRGMNDALGMNDAPGMDDAVGMDDGPAGELKEILAFIRPGKQLATRQALEAAGVISYTTVRVMGRGRQLGLRSDDAAHDPVAIPFLPKQCLSLLVGAAQVPVALEAIQKANRSGAGEHGDGKVFVFDVGEALRISTDERGAAAV